MSTSQGKVGRAVVLVLGALLTIPASAAAQTSARPETGTPVGSVNTATVANVDGQAVYRLTGVAQGYKGDRYNVHVELRDSNGATIGSLTRDIQPSTGSWEIIIIGVKGGVRYEVCFSEFPGVAGSSPEQVGECLVGDLRADVPGPGVMGLGLLALALLMTGATVMARRGALFRVG